MKLEDKEDRSYGGGKSGGMPIAEAIGDSYSKLLQNASYRYFALILGAPVNLFTLLVHRARKAGDVHTSVLRETREELLASGLQEKLHSISPRSCTVRPASSGRSLRKPDLRQRRRS